LLVVEGARRTLHRLSNQQPATSNQQRETRGTYDFNLETCWPIPRDVALCREASDLDACNRGSTHALHGFMISQKSSFRSFALTFTLGAVAGAVVALLYAPMTGRKLQRKVAGVTERMRDAVEDSVDNVQNVLRKVANA